MKIKSLEEIQNALQPIADEMQIEIVENPGLANLIKQNVPPVLEKFGL
jgi:hypothetical protein